MYNVCPVKITHMYDEIQIYFFLFNSLSLLDPAIPTTQSPWPWPLFLLSLTKPCLHLHGLPPPCSHSLQKIGNSGVEIKMLWKLKLGQPWKTMVGRVRVRGQYHRKQSQRGLQLPFFSKHPFYFPHNKGDFNCMFSFFFFLFLCSYLLLLQFSIGSCKLSRHFS